MDSGYEIDRLWAVVTQIQLYLYCVYSPDRGKGNDRPPEALTSSFEKRSRELFLIVSGVLCGDKKLQLCTESKSSIIITIYN